MTKLTIVRHATTGNVLSVYRGTPHLGLIMCPTAGDHDDYIARPSAPYCDTLADATFATEREAVDYLASIPA